MSSIQNYSLSEAAEILRCKPGFLEQNLSVLPSHQKLGQSIAFDEGELLAIKEWCRRRPKRSVDEPEPTSKTGLTLTSIRPSGARRTAT